jgi:tRNA nucleotidyltransferase/poly(A) polymerase
LFLRSIVSAFFGDLFVDFVNLRTETYSENSRIPIMKLGTAEEDAYRRDLTINSLFYNIHTSQIEDFTGKGLHDIQNQMIDTPLDAITTLEDDPLRAFRAIRFACRFQFSIAKSLLEASSMSSLHHAIQIKVSSERIYVEFEQMLSGLSFERASYLLYQTGLWRTIIPNPSISSSPLKSSSSISSSSISLGNTTISPMGLNMMHSLGVFSVLYYYALPQILRSTNFSSSSSESRGTSYPHTMKALQSIAEDRTKLKPFK